MVQVVCATRFVAELLQQVYAEIAGYLELLRATVWSVVTLRDAIRRCTPRVFGACHAGWKTSRLARCRPRPEDSGDASTAYLDALPASLQPGSGVRERCFFGRRSQASCAAGRAGRGAARSRLERRPT